MDPRATTEELDRLLDGINVDRSHGERRPHKPLLLLYALARLVGHGERTLSYVQAAEELGPLLRRFAPPAGRVRPEYPWWRLQRDGLWELTGETSIATNRSGDPSVRELRATSGRFPERFALLLLRDRRIVQHVVDKLLDAHFPPSWHGEVLAATGFEVDDADAIGAADLVRESVSRWRRPTAFSQAVLRAYEFRCALTGYRVELAGAPVALEAAHLHWHCLGGPARVENGLALQPTLHRLLDCGAWTLDDDRRVLVASELIEDPAAQLLTPLRGRRIRAPAPGHPPLALEHIRWHRERKLGGVFRG